MPVVSSEILLLFIGSKCYATKKIINWPFQNCNGQRPTFLLNMFLRHLKKTTT